MKTVHKVFFKNLKVANLDQPPNYPTSNIQVPERGLELLTPYVTLITLIAIAGAAITHWRKERTRKMQKSK